MRLLATACSSALARSVLLRKGPIVLWRLCVSCVSNGVVIWRTIGHLIDQLCMQTPPQVLRAFELSFARSIPNGAAGMKERTDGVQVHNKSEDREATIQSCDYVFH